ncbi:MAG: hydroxysqualene dehydroxylase HpnE [Ignavibacteriaceae bacterium]|nr:hydroxysqualene dehydroxylase HpnE [Ignavibacteriaceae bacterium]
MKKCVVIGSGLAGLTSAAYLSLNGFQVEILEASPKPGGRAYSFKDSETGSIIDNGQHIMMGCYKETLKFFNLIGARENLILQDRIKVNFVKENFNLLPLQASGLPYPLNLLSALLNYKALTFKDRLLFLKFFLSLPFVLEKDIKSLSVYDWLIEEKQNENIIKAFWEILAVGALNTNIKKASAVTFAIILKEIFFRGNKVATIIIPKLGLSETYCKNALSFIEEHNGKINFGEQVTDIKFSNEMVFEIETTKRKITEFDFVISAVPLYALEKMLPEFKSEYNFELTYSSIVSIHIWLKENHLDELFYGLIGSPVHWIFNHQEHVTLVISDAGEFVNMSNEEIFNMVATELEKYVKIAKDKIISYKVIKEKRATFIPSKEILNTRPKQRTPLQNFIIAGDWVNTGLPSTIESAVKSGRIAAQLIIG